MDTDGVKRRIISLFLRGFLFTFFSKFFLLSSHFVAGSLHVALAYMLPNVKEKTNKFHFIANPRCHLRCLLYTLSSLVSLYFFSILPFSRNKETG